MNMNLKLNFDFKKLWPILRKLEPYLFGLALIAVFAYTAWVVNAALNVQASTGALPVDPLHPTAPKITFDKKAIEAVKNLSVVQGDVPIGSLGKDDPFK
jgi:hypothetical protein